MKPRTLSATALILLAPLVVLAFQAQSDQFRKRDLKSRPFTAGSLKITFISLQKRRAAKSQSLDIDGAYTLAMMSRRPT